MTVPDAQAGANEARKAALSAAVRELSQIAESFEQWAEDQRAKFTHPNGVTPADCQKWMSDWLSDFYVVGFFDRPNGRSQPRKPFSLLVDVFRMYMPNVAPSLTDTYDLFHRWVRETIRDFENEQKLEVPLHSHPICSFLDHAPGFVAGRFRQIAEMVQEEGKAGKGKRKSKKAKIALIAGYLAEHFNATSPEIAGETGIDESDVRRLWGPIKKELSGGKRDKPKGSKTNGTIEAEDKSASCEICSAPLLHSFECTLCRDVIVGECKTCHYTNTHPNDAIP